MLVEILFVRHGESEANVAQHQTSCGTIKHLLMRDPVLTPKGMQESNDRGENMPEVDIALCSQLLRAMQTALLMCPEKLIHVVPFLNELGTGLDNLPHSQPTQNSILGCDFKRIVHLPKQHENTFLQYISKHILPKFNGNKHVKIALFTHSRLMRKHLNMSLSELPNNCTVSKKYYFV
tara:strand:- start:139 stop:672 length:534 start_codon:yes stop_codon:yes gene_type:complete